jgi:hypothetical protein
VAQGLGISHGFDVKDELILIGVGVVLEEEPTEVEGEIEEILHVVGQEVITYVLT